MARLRDLQPGASLGRYELVLRVAQGGMGEIWAARLKGSRGFQKVVAVKTLLPELVKSLQAQGADDIIVFAGGVIPAQDYDYLYQAGAKAIFGPGTRIEDSAIRVLEEIRKARG
jgi:hypothetical protein